MKNMTEKQRAMQRREDTMMRKIRRKAREIYDLPPMPRVVMMDLNHDGYIDFHEFLDWWQGEDWDT